MKKCNRTIDDFVSEGECTFVDYEDSIRKEPSLASYHPKACENDNKYTAKTYKTEDGKRIKLEVNWNDKIIRVLKSMEFELNNNMLTCHLSPPIQFGKEWRLYRWDIEIVKLKDCNDKVVDTFKDTLYWKRYDFNKITELISLIQNPENNNKSFVSLAKLSKEAVVKTETYWWWPK